MIFFFVGNSLCKIFFSQVKDESWIVELESTGARFFSPCTIFFHTCTWCHLTTGYNYHINFVISPVYFKRIRHTGVGYV